MRRPRWSVIAPMLAAMCCASAMSSKPAATAAVEPAVPPLQLPTPVTRTLPNGLRVAVFTTSRTPVVLAQLLVPAGAAAESDSTPGLAALTADLTHEGTTSRTAAEFANELDRLGASFSVWAGQDFALVACGARPEAFENSLELMSDAVINPLLGGDDFAPARDAWVRRLSVQHENLALVADERAAEMAFAPHPYAHVPAADMDALLGTTYASVKAFHRDRWRPDHAVLAIVGDVAPDRAFAAATDWFGRWEGRSAPDRARPAPKANAGVRIVDVPAGRRAEVRVAMTGPGLADAGFASWSLAEVALEAGRLPEGARASLVPARDASLILLSAIAPVEQAADRARAMIDAFHALAAAPPTGSALQAIRRRASQAYPLTLETMGAFASRWQMDDFAGLPPDEVTHAGERLAAAEVAPVAHLLAGAPAVLVLGSAEALRGPLAALGHVELAPLQNTRSAAPRSLRPPTAEQRRRGRAAVAAAMLAHGGAARMAAIRSLVFEGEMTVTTGPQEMMGQFSLVRIEPDRLSFATRVSDYESRQVLVGSRGWSLTRTDSVSVTEMDSLGVRSLIAAFGSDLIHELRAAAAPGSGAAWRGTEVVKGRKCDLIEFDSPTNGPQRMAIDVLTHRVLALDGALGPDLVWHDRRLLADYRLVNKLLLPHIEDRLVGGTRVSHTLTRQVGVDREIDPRLFDPPKSTRP